MNSCHAQTEPSCDDQDCDQRAVLQPVAGREGAATSSSASFSADAQMLRGFGAFGARRGEIRDQKRYDGQSGGYQQRLGKKNRFGERNDTGDRQQRFRQTVWIRLQLRCRRSSIHSAQVAPMPR